MNWRDGESNPKILQHSAAFFQRFDYGDALKIEGKMSHLNIAFDQYASIKHCNALHFGNKHTVLVYVSEYFHNNGSTRHLCSIISLEIRVVSLQIRLVQDVYVEFTSLH